MISLSMVADPRHLRARWGIAVVGWMLWGISLVMPIRAKSLRLWTIYPEAIHAISRGRLLAGGVSDAVEAAALLGFLLATCIMGVSLLLVGLNHSTHARVRRWRWLGLGLLAMTQLSVMMGFKRTLDYWNVHLLVLAHVMVAVAVLPWPREREVMGAGFEVMLPEEQRPEG